MTGKSWRAAATVAVVASAAALSFAAALTTSPQPAIADDCPGDPEPLSLLSGEFHSSLTALSVANLRHRLR